jgi:hypothetical protein
LKKIDSQFSAQLSQRLIAGEDHYRDDMIPLLTEANVVSAFNHLRSGIPNSKDYPVISEAEVTNLRTNLSSFAPHLFQMKKTSYSPIEAVILLFLIVYNNGNLNVGGVLVESDRPRTTAVSMTQSLQTQINGLSSPELERWIDDVFRQLNV